jgi:hypothetical protein
LHTRLKSVGVTLGSGLILLVGWLSGQEELQLALQLGAAAAMGGLLWRYEVRGERLQAERAAELSTAREEVSAAQRGVRLVLDHIDQGLLMVAPDGRVAPERSRAAERLMPSPPGAVRFWELLSDEQPEVAEQLRLGWRQVFEGSLALSELPSRCALHGRCLSLGYVPVSEGGRLMSVLVTVSDVTAEAREQLPASEVSVSERTDHDALVRAAQQALLHAERLHRAPPRLQLQSEGVPLSDRWEPFWAAATHIVHNALDHGIEAPEERARLGKPPTGELTMSVHWASEGIFVSFRDDGRGIDWQAVARRASQLGLPSSTEQDLVGALFSDPERGLGAVWTAIDPLGGAVQVESVSGRGTTVRFWFPPSSAQQTPLADRLSA